MHDIVDGETQLNALQAYVRNYKQADLTLTGTVRKATLVNQSTKATTSTPGPNRRSSIISHGNGSASRSSTVHGKVEEPAGNGTGASRSHPLCATCGVDVSPKWRPLQTTHAYSLAYGERDADADTIMHNGSVQTIHEQTGMPDHASNGNSDARNVAYQCNKCWIKSGQDPNTDAQDRPVEKATVQMLPMPATIASIDQAGPGLGAEAARYTSWQETGQMNSVPTSTYTAAWRRHSQSPPPFHAQPNGVHAHGQHHNHLNGQHQLPPLAAPGPSIQPVLLPAPMPMLAPSHHNGPSSNGHMSPNQRTPPPARLVNGLGHVYQAIQPAPPPETTPVNGGASASPSLRNLLS